MKLLYNYHKIAEGHRVVESILGSRFYFILSYAATTPIIGKPNQFNFCKTWEEKWLSMGVSFGKKEGEKEREKRRHGLSALIQINTIYAGEASPCGATPYPPVSFGVRKSLPAMA